MTLRRDRLVAAVLVAAAISWPFVYGWVWGLLAPLFLAMAWWVQR